MQTPIEQLLELTPRERLDRITAVESQISKLESVIQVARSDYNDGGGYERRLRDAKQAVERMQKMLDDMVARHENAPEIIEASQREIQSLREERLLLKNANDVARLLDLQEKINDANGEN